jgi:hypothetical protein
MRRIVQLASGGALLAALATPALAQNSASATASGSATIIQPLTISKTADLGFGTIVKPTSGTSTVTVSATGNSRTITGAGNAAAANAAGVSSAAFLVQGEGAQHFSISVPASFAMTSGTNTLTVTTSNPTGATGLLSGSLGQTGSLTLGVGGSFTLTSATKSGAYSGNFVVTVQYN